ncbi:MAG TPA: choice-of-anchor J domain-containing protein [Dokdonella sp.]|uniref:choice-of-anchor J domain-containing protein n=1 Tax=Dokdonella sp. TaxID=2291710 RepID=UPI002CD19E60|nr:choice-of-anchor J domain-containing protein [Dokdonella sp.]HUD42115.1 choice-of-anchor J domain-containing protein [Dokdonella sp.]
MRGPFFPDMATAQSVAAERPNPAVPSGPDTPPRVVAEGFDDVIRMTGDGRFLMAGGVFSEGWIRQNNSDAPGNAWEQGIDLLMTAYDGHAGAYAGSHPRSTLSNTGTISSWLLSPPINFSPGTKLSFYTRALAYAGSVLMPSRLQVRACTDGDCTDVGAWPEDVGGFQDMLLDINPAETPWTYPSEWTRYELTAADGLPTSGTGRVAFRHYAHQNDGVLRGNWTGLDRVVVEQGEGEASDLDLEITVSAVDPAQPDACGTATAIEVTAGDQVNLCYRIFNRTAQTLRHHWLRDDHVGPVLSDHAQDVPPGGSFQYNRIVTVSRSMSPSATWTASADPPGYTVDDTQPAQYLDVTDGQSLDTQWGAELPFPPDFDFRFYGERVDTLCVTHFGVVSTKRFDFCTPFFLDWGVRPLPDSELTIYGAAASLYYTNLSMSPPATSGVYQKIVGQAPNRRYVIAYQQRTTTYGSPLPEYGLSAQVIFNEGTDVIEFQYANVQFGDQFGCGFGGCAGIGLQNKNIGQQYSHLSPSLAGVDRIVWTPSDPASHTRTRQVRIVARSAELELAADRVEASAAPGATATVTFGIGNGGDARLVWEAGAASPNGHLGGGPRLALPDRSASFAAAVERQPQPWFTQPTGREAEVAMPAGTDESLWAFDIYGGYLVSTNAQTPGWASGDGTIRGYAAGRTITGTDFLDDDFSRLYAFDAADRQLLRYEPLAHEPNVYAAETVIGRVDLPVGQVGSGLKQDPTSGSVYLASSDGTASSLWRVDPETAVLWPVGAITDAPGIISIDFDNDGRLYGVDVIANALVAIDKTSGAAEPVGSLGFSAQGSFAALAFDPADDERLYLATCQATPCSFYRVDRATGQASLIGPISGSSTQFGAMSFATPGARCTALEEIPWLSLDQTAGTVEPGAPEVELRLQLDAGSLPEGVYAADLCIHSNDLLHRRAVVPVRFSVGLEADRLFADDFES